MMNLDEFLEEQRKLLLLFEAWYRTEHALQPEQFPLMNLRGDWDEQVMMFNPDWIRETKT